MDRPGIEAVIFDCFGVLQVEYTHAFYEEYVADYDQLRPQLLELNSQRDYGFISQTEFIQAVAELSNLERGFVESKMSPKLTRNQPLLDYIGQLKGRYRLGMISSWVLRRFDGSLAKQLRQTNFQISHQLTYWSQ